MIRRMLIRPGSLVVLSRRLWMMLRATLVRRALDEIRAYVCAKSAEPADRQTLGCCWEAKKGEKETADVRRIQRLWSDGTAYGGTLDLPSAQVRCPHVSPH